MRLYRRPWLFAALVLVAAVCVLVTLATAQQVAPSSLAASPAAPAAQPRAPAAGTREAQAAAPAPPPPRIDTGDTAWMLTSTALVLMMTAPGLALFYGGMVRRQNVLGTIMQSFIIMALISIQWVLWGYSLAFGPDIRGLIGSLDWFGLKGVGLEPFPDYAGTIPHQAFMIYQLMFAIITPALITGAFAERMKFGGFLVFTLLWTTFIYDPLAHWVWGWADGSGTSGPWISPAAPWCTSAPASRPWWPPCGSSSSSKPPDR